jgi:hypothetical protein
MYWRLLERGGLLIADRENPSLDFEPAPQLKRVPILGPSSIGGERKKQKSKTKKQDTHSFSQKSKTPTAFPGKKARHPQLFRTKLILTQP